MHYPFPNIAERVSSTEIQLTVATRRPQATVSFLKLLQNHPCCMLSAERNHRHSPARVRAASDKEQVVILLATLRSLKGKVLSTVAHNAVDRAAIGVILALDIERCPKVFHHNVLPQIRQAH